MIDRNRPERLAHYAYRKAAHEESDRVSKRIISRTSVPFEPIKPAERPVFEPIQVPEYRPLPIPEFKPTQVQYRDL